MGRPKSNRPTQKEQLRTLRRNLVESRLECAKLRKELKELRAATQLIVNAIGQDRIYEIVADSA